MSEDLRRSLRRWMASCHLIALCAGLAAQQETQPFATGAAYPDRESLLNIPTERPFNPPNGVKLPARFDLASWFPEAGAQGDRNSCTGWAVGYALRSYQENRLNRVDPERDTSGTVAFSPAFVYNYTMQYLSKGDCDQGTDLLDALTVAVDNGVCRWSTLPYDSALTACQDSIPLQALSEANKHRMRDPLGLELDNRVQWKHHLFAGQPIVVAMSIDRSFMTLGLEAAASGKEFVWAGPDTLDPDLLIVGHALICAGYDDADSTYLVLNSWGTDWGRNGWCRIPYHVMAEWCYGAYVAEAAAPSEPERTPCLPADDRMDSGTVLNESFKEGQHQEFEGLRLSCRDVSDDLHTVTVDVDGMAYGAEVHRRLTFRRGQPVDFHLLDCKWTFTMRPYGLFVNRSNPRVRFRLEKAHPSEDMHIQGILDRVDLHKRW
ncbi:MAG: C1 family peptidase [Flavobacteriales bacterium]|nr:C1 family peptidase [Flavobacteriales bacterium]